MLSASCIEKIGLFVGGVFLGNCRRKKYFSSKDAKKHMFIVLQRL